MYKSHVNGHTSTAQALSGRLARLLPFALLLGIAAALLIPNLAQAAVGEQSPDGVWTQIDAASLPDAVSKAERVMPSKYSLFEISDGALDGILATAPMEFSGAAKNSAILTLPMPDGSFQSFAIQESPILSEQMQEWNPDIKTYLGQGIDDPTATVRFDITMFGFRAMVLSTNGAVMIDPVQLTNTEYYMSYFKRDFPASEEPFECGTVSEALGDKNFNTSNTALANGDELTTYRLVVTATGEYTEYFGSVAAAVAQIVTTFNRVDGIYENDVAVRFNLVRTVVFTDPDTDPFTNGESVDGTLLNQNQAVVDDSVGSSNYDIGHIVSQGGSGGLAAHGVCNSSNKARGGTSRGTPSGDPFDVDYVAHEVGHQMGGDHTFNANQQYSCNNANRTGSSAYERGSGSTIMAYAGICGNQDLQPHSDPYFHVRSLEQIINKVNSAGCGAVTSTGNSPPTADAQTDWTIPTGTPFKLTGVGSDPDGDALTYCWEQYDLGDPEPPVDYANGPLFRSFNPTTSPSRTFPNLDDLLAGNPTPWESLPTVDRTMDFRLTVRDNRAGGGGVDWDDMSITVTGDPFYVTYPNGGESLSSGCSITVTWVVGGGDVASDVNIWLSTDGGYTLDYLLANTANDGSADVTIPCGVNTNNARILIAAAGNIFFDVSDGDFEIDSQAPQLDYASANGGSVGDDCSYLVTFSAGLSDDCSLATGDVDVDVSLYTANATLGTPTINKVQADGQTVTITGQVLVSDLLYSPATVVITLDADDNCGNNYTTTFSADVVDDTDPVISCPGDLTFECDNVGDFGFPTATDNCDDDPFIQLIARDSIPGGCAQEYQLVLTYRASDLSGNSDTCQQTITVEDTTPPEITCPDTLEFVFVSPTRAQVLFDIEATDNCADTLVIQSDSASGSVFVLGEHTISASVGDGCGGADTCAFSFRLVPLDIHPTSCPNPLNAKAGGPNHALAKTGPLATFDDDPEAFSGAVVPVAILGTDDLDVKQIDIASLRLEGVAPVKAHYEDVSTPVTDEPGESCRCSTAGADGYLDLVLHFDRQALVAALGTVYDGDELMLTLTGAMSDGILLAGGDCVVIRGRKHTAFDSESQGDGSTEGYAVWNMPNPFNPTTTISYQLPTGGEVSLVVYNVLGQEVKTLVDSYQPSGQHSVEWKGENGFGQQVSSGMYFYRLQVGDVSITRKMMLLK